MWVRGLFASSVALLVLHGVPSTAYAQFRADGPDSPVRLAPFKQGAVKVTFDLLPTSMSFDLPSYPCLVTENGIRFCAGFAETYDPLQSPKDPLASFETSYDDTNEHARMWVQSQNDARIIVRVRGALVSDVGKLIAHTAVKSGSPYGEGDWVDEWYTVYPDGIYARHVKIYTGLADRSVPFGVDREPPRVIHEFMEAMVLGRTGRTPKEEIEDQPVTLVQTVSAHSETEIDGGQSKAFSGKSFTKDFGEFSRANIMVVNLKSNFRPFVIAMPHGVQAQPYLPDGKSPLGFQVWSGDEPGHYTAALMHLINYSHYRRSDRTLEQVYLGGMIEAKAPTNSLVPLAWSWVAPPKLVTTDGTRHDYDSSQRAYVVDASTNAQAVEFELLADSDYYGIKSTIERPAFVLRGWGPSGARLEINGKARSARTDVRFGHEVRDGTTDLVVWANFESSKPARFLISRERP